MCSSKGKDEGGEELTGRAMSRFWVAKKVFEHFFLAPKHTQRNSSAYNSFPYRAGNELATLEELKEQGDCVIAGLQRPILVKPHFGDL